MGSFTFKWPHAADEVYVTGTFDDWSKSEKLDKVGESFEKTVSLPEFDEKILYKFVVDGQWVADHTAPSEKDSSGNDNNILKPQDIAKTAVMNSAAPGSTTAALAGQVPYEEKTPGGDLPGAFPETPALDLNKQLKADPLPAAPGAVNPIQLAPGEKVPNDLKTSGVTDNVTLDKESYEKSDRIPGLETQLPPVTGNMIPESSLPIAGGNDVTINSVGPGSTTAALAGKVPLEEPKVPEVVRESQEKAGVDAEASGLSSEVKEKEKVEEELLQKVPEAPATSIGTAGQGTEKSENDKTLVETVTGTVAAIGGAAVAAAVAARDTVLPYASSAATQATAAAQDAATKLPDSVKDALPAPVKDAVVTTQKENVREEVSPEVPAEVKESIAEAGKSPEAAANTAAVEDKAKVEAELLKEVKKVPAEGEASVDKAKEATKETVAKVTDKATDKPTESKASATKPTTEADEAASAAARKKKNRLSSMFSKIKHKISDKK